MAAKNQNTVVTATQKTEPGAKKDALATALAQIEKQFGKGAVMKLGDNAAMQVEAISTGSLGLDMALGVGGVPRGRIVEVYGPESSGKTTLALHILAEAQKQGGEVAFIDVEHALDPVYAEALGVDINNLFPADERAYALLSLMDERMPSQRNGIYFDASGHEDDRRSDLEALMRRPEGVPRSPYDPQPNSDTASRSQGDQS